MWSIFWNKNTSLVKQNSQIPNQSHVIQVYSRSSSHLLLYHGTRFCVEPSNPEKSLQSTPDVHGSHIESSISTLPYAVTKWPESSSAYEASKKPKLAIKSESESSASSPKTPPLEPRRKSLLEEKRALSQRRHFDSSRHTSGDTVIAVTVDEESARSNFLAFEEKSQVEKTKKKARHISVHKFDTFSTFEGTFDEDTGVGYLAGIEENYSDNYEKQNEDYAYFQDNMAHILAGNTEKSKSLNQDSAVRIFNYRCHSRAWLVTGKCNLLH